MLAAISFIIVILFSLIVVKVGSLMLEATGLSKDIAAFQAQSAFSGVGFTTAESETLMTHPMRRKILRFLMLMGSAGLTSAIATLILTFTSSGDALVFNVSIITVVMLVLFYISRTTYFDHVVKHLMEKPLKHIKKKVALLDYERVLGISKGFTIGTFEIPKRHWMVNKSIKDLQLEKEGVIILGVYREVHGHEEYLGVPSLDFKAHNKDKILVYGKEETISNLAKREKGSKGTAERKEAEREHKKFELIKKIDEEKLSEAAKKSK
jgi:hypothetical protein